jgi:hypothetical protein
MMSAHAPRAWSKRVLSWLILERKIDLFFANGLMIERIREFSLKYELLDQIEKRVSDPSIVEKFQDLLSSENSSEQFENERDVFDISWNNEPRNLPIEIFMYHDLIDWDNGTVSGELEYYEKELENEWQDLRRLFDHSHWSVELSGMCFELSAIEMLAPSAVIPMSDLFSIPVSATAEPKRAGGPGRRREYDWDGALLYLLGQAEINAIAPDPHAHGAQADIKRLLADWFSNNGGKVPADSQLETMAKRALESVRNAKP